MAFDLDALIDDCSNRSQVLSDSCKRNQALVDQLVQTCDSLKTQVNHSVQDAEKALQTLEAQIGDLEKTVDASLSRVATDIDTCAATAQGAHDAIVSEYQDVANKLVPGLAARIAQAHADAQSWLHQLQARYDAFTAQAAADATAMQAKVAEAEQQVKLLQSAAADHQAALESRRTALLASYDQFDAEVTKGLKSLDADFDATLKKGEDALHKLVDNVKATAAQASTTCTASFTTDCVQDLTRLSSDLSQVVAALKDLTKKPRDLADTQVGDVTGRLKKAQTPLGDVANTVKVAHNQFNLC